MKRAVPGTLLMIWVCRIALGQAAEAPEKFEIADVHASPSSTSGGALMG